MKSHSRIRSCLQLQEISQPNSAENLAAEFAAVLQSQKISQLSSQLCSCKKSRSCLHLQEISQPNSQLFSAAGHLTAEFATVCSSRKIISQPNSQLFAAARNLSAEFAAVCSCKKSHSRIQNCLQLAAELVTNSNSSIIKLRVLQVKLTVSTIIQNYSQNPNFFLGGFATELPLLVGRSSPPTGSATPVAARPPSTRLTSFIPEPSALAAVFAAVFFMFRISQPPEKLVHI